MKTRAEWPCKKAQSPVNQMGVPTKTLLKKKRELARKLEIGNTNLSPLIHKYTTCKMRIILRSLSSQEEKKNSNSNTYLQIDTLFHEYTSCNDVEYYERGLFLLWWTETSLPTREWNWFGGSGISRSIESNRIELQEKHTKPHIYEQSQSEEHWIFTVTRRIYLQTMSYMQMKRRKGKGKKCNFFPNPWFSAYPHKVSCFGYV